MKIDDLCNEIVEELNTSRYRTRYILYSASFWGRLWCFLVLGAPALSVLPLLIVLTKEGEITEQTLTGVCCSLIVVPIVAVSIFLCCCFGKNMIKVCTYFLHNRDILFHIKTKTYKDADTERFHLLYFLRLYRYHLMIIIKSVYQISKVNLNVLFSLITIDLSKRLMMFTCARIP